MLIAIGSVVSFDSGVMYVEWRIRSVSAVAQWMGCFVLVSILARLGFVACRERV